MSIFVVVKAEMRMNLFFLSFRSRFLQCPPFRCPTCFVCSQTQIFIRTATGPLIKIGEFILD
jgi:hypothetical protein